MRAIVPALLVILVVGSSVHATELWKSAEPAFAYAPLFDRTSAITFYYESESQGFNLLLKLGRAQVDFGIINVLQIPEHEFPGGVYLDEHTLLTRAVSGIEIDTGDEPATLLTFSFGW